jgi:hypothetical protein
MRHRVRTCAIAAAALLLTSVPALAGGQENNSVTKHVSAIRVPNGTITVDGKFDEPAWQQAEPAAEFVQMQPVEGAPATDAHQSEIRFTMRRREPLRRRDLPRGRAGQAGHQRPEARLRGRAHGDLSSSSSIPSATG